MEESEYAKLVKEYKDIGYVEIGDINHPYFFPKVSEELKEMFSKQLAYIWGNKYLK